MQIQSFFPHVVVFPRNQLLDKITKESFAKTVLVFEESLFFKQMHPKLEAHFSKNLHVLNPVVTAKKDYVFSDHFFFDPNISFTANLNHFAKKNLHLETDLQTAAIYHSIQKDKKLVVIHPSASKPSKTWGSTKFKQIERLLIKKGFEVKYATLPFEEEMVKNGLYSGLENLHQMVELLLKASILIGNDSGVSHLASACNTPSVIISRNVRIQRFWGPDFEGKSFPLFPPRFLPNLKGLRIRDKHWRHFVFKKDVLKKALKILGST
jgi:hypothetical protein